MKHAIPMLQHCTSTPKPMHTKNAKRAESLLNCLLYKILQLPTKPIKITHHNASSIWVSSV
ncbi:Uncharacterised protein [Vibrio cholerae]|nr:Uncharacterised protein [Vibrio cholerae]